MTLVFHLFAPWGAMSENVAMMLTQEIVLTVIGVVVVAWTIGSAVRVLEWLLDIVF